MMKQGTQRDTGAEARVSSEDLIKQCRDGANRLQVLDQIELCVLFERAADRIERLAHDLKCAREDIREIEREARQAVAEARTEERYRERGEEW